MESAEAMCGSPDATGFSDRTVADLSWAIRGADLLASECCEPAQMDGGDELQGWLSSVDADPAPLHAFVRGSLTRRPFRLGSYFEDLVGFYVEVRLAERCERGVPIRLDGRTLGELDLLYEAAGVRYHWELAVKFYLFAPGLAAVPGECFVGPQVRDRLHLKIARLRDHQLPLSGREAAAARLATWLPLRRSALVRGRLFYPAQSDWRTSPIVADLAPGHDRGWWSHVEALGDGLPSASGYAWLSREQWLAPVDARRDPIGVLDRDGVLRSVRAFFAAGSAAALRSRVVAGLDAEGVEVHRGFVVSTGWPGAGL